MRKPLKWENNKKKVRELRAKIIEAITEQNRLLSKTNQLLEQKKTEAEQALTDVNIAKQQAEDNLIKAKLAAVKALKLDQEIKDILITLTSQIHIIDISPNKKFMIYLAADATKANLGMTRAVLGKYKVELEEKLK